jgi:CDP-diacylglycerol--serine O-phosphatidyltransferase
LFIPVVFTSHFVLPPTQMKFVLDGVYLLLAIAMVADFKMPKLRGIWYGIFGMGAVALTVIYGWVIFTVG